MERSPVRQSATETERLHLQLDRRWVKALRREAADQRMTLRAVVERCIADRYDPARKQIGERWVAKELRRVQREVAQVRFSNEVMVELFVLAARQLMARLPMSAPVNARAGELMYQSLVAEMERCFERDTPVLRRLLDALQQQIEDAAVTPRETPPE